MSVALLCSALMTVATSSSVSPADSQRIVEQVHSETLAEFASTGLKPTELEISLSVFTNGEPGPIGHVHGDTNMYPASVVKLFYAGYFATLLDSKKVKMTQENERALKDMLFESSNDATGHILDVITGTTGGPELEGRALKQWMEKRQAVNEWLKKQGYRNQNACQKTWNEGPYGRERQGYGPNFELRNSLSPNSCTRMMCDIMTNKFSSKTSNEWIRKFTLRTKDGQGIEAGGQTAGFLGEVFPAEWTWYSKAGQAYQVRHDVAYVKATNGTEFVLTVFTDHHGSNSKLLPSVAKKVVDALGAK